MLQKLLDLTPKSHPEYLETLALFRATDVLIKVMTEVKAREDEYEAAKRLLERVRGLPAGSGLLRRERRLLRHGPLVRVPVSDGAANDGEQPGQRTSRFMEAINDWDRRKHAGSTPSNVTTGSYGSYNPSIITDGQAADPTRPAPCSTRTSVYAFAFSDVILLATPIAGERDLWMLCEDVGVARVVDVEGKGEAFHPIRASAS